MRPLAERQREFAAALLDPRRPVPEGLCGSPGTHAAERFAVYRDNVAVGLTESLRSTYPVVERLVGSECFDALAWPYAAHSPPTSAVLLRYGAGFADYLQANHAALGLDYLADVARIEWQWLSAYYADEASPLALDVLQRVPPRTLARSSLRLHPSLCWLGVAHSAYSIWRAHRDGAPQGELHVGDEAEYLLFARPHDTVLACAVSPAMLALLDALAAGASALQAARRALASEPRADLAALFSILLQTGAVTALEEQ